jgi:large conductance mechanosensitive channel
MVISLSFTHLNEILLDSFIIFFDTFMKGFINFVREQGVVGLAVGFILGGAISKVVTALVTDIINPIIGLAVGSVGGLKTASFHIGSANIMYGDMLSVIIDFLVVALVVYYGVKIIGLEKLDKKKA